MNRVNIVAVGGIKEKFFKDAIAEYSKRLHAFAYLNFIEIDEKAHKEISPKIESETLDLMKVLSKLKGNKYLLDIKGQLVNSQQFAQILSSEMDATFVIGGSDGVSRSIEQSITSTLSLGKITLPHQLCRVVLIEQIYRGFMIASGRAYHK
ncbi:MAG: 23S rRNA (pseudouridine(1915)-N(3))-methyltransferase RlmH [Clostridiales bacterium]|jgi:23S rRNA (pseudouridine1915-N3)-methyltransferase|nr:23S rRNA (pseudouridine(1915)-N(3))-methyltransferase RlmH [Clostridiales bacterium]